MKNLLAVVRALITQTETQGRSTEDYRDALLARLAALTDAQELILAHGGTINLRARTCRSRPRRPCP